MFQLFVGTYQDASYIYLISSMIHFNYLNVSHRINFHSARQLNAAIPVASSSEANAADGNLDK